MNRIIDGSFWLLKAMIALFLAIMVDGLHKEVLAGIGKARTSK